MNTLQQYRLDPRINLLGSWRNYTIREDKFVYPFLSECIQDSDELDWPPEHENCFVLWGPDSLEENSSSLLKLHKLILFKKLEPKMGVFSEINLWDWHWKNVFINYPSQVLTKKAYREFKSEEADQDRREGFEADYMHLVTRELPSVSGSWEELERRLMIIGRGNILTDEEHSKLMKSIECRHMHQKTLDYLSVRSVLKQSCSSGLDYGSWIDFLKLVERECPANLWSNSGFHLENMLVSRFTLWWGWSDAPFTCMARLIHSHLDTMIREGYLLRELNKGKSVKYQLSEDGYKRLIASKDGKGENKWLGLLRSVDLASTTKEIILNLITKLF